MAQTVKRLPTMRETRVHSLGQEDPLEKEMATHSSILAWRIPWTEEPGSYSPWGHKESDTTERPHFHFVFRSQVAQTVKRLPTMQETQVQSLGREDPLEKKMVTNSNILAWRIPWTEEPGSYSPWGRKELDMTEQLHFLSFMSPVPYCLNYCSFISRESLKVR